MFDTNHQLYYPAHPGDPSYDDFIFGEGATPPEGPSVLAEFFGDIILVNGKAWPKLEVEPRKYRIRLLNGSDSRFYVLSFKDELPWFQIGTDNGFLANAIEIGNPVESEAGGELIIAPGERMDLILDFTGKSNQEFTLWNYGPDEPFGGDVDLDLNRPTAQIMKFVVSKSLNQNISEASIEKGASLRKSSLPEIPSSYVTAQQNLVLFEATDEYGRLKPMLGTLAQGSADWDEPITENPKLNETQVWEIFNATMDAHPIHLHLVSFQVLGRGTYTGEVESIDEDDGEMHHEGSMSMGGSKVQLKLHGRGEWRSPEPNELGWKDTHIVYPGEFSQVRATFDRQGLYVWHCHILSHEDHEMMRPFYVGQMPVGMQKPMKEVMVQAAPNPFNSSTSILFSISNDETVNLVVYTDKGVKCYQHTAFYNSGQHALLWDGRDMNGNLLPEGLYYYKLSGTDFENNNRLVIKR
jgi:spore coat protein A